MLDASLGPNPGLERRAMVNQASGASRTLVVVDDQSCVYGYYAMAAGAVSHPMATSGMQRNMPDPVPEMDLARLGVDHHAEPWRPGSAAAGRASRRATASRSWT